MGWKSKTSSKSIVLYYPVLSYLTDMDKGLHRFPYAVWSLVPPLESAGFTVKVIDGRVDNKEDFIKAVQEGPLFVGISSLTGGQLTDAQWAANKVREIDPKIPIVWGGWHVTLLPEESAKEPLVDVIVAGRGEQAIVSLASKIQSGEPLPKIIRTPLIEDFQRVPFDRINLRKYGPYFGYTTSTGCAWACTFCAIQKIYNHKMFYKPLDQVLDELRYVVDHYPNMVQLCIDDDLFFLNRKRVIEFCEKWKFYGGVPMSVLVHVNVMNKYPEDIMKLVVASGFKIILIGAESGNQIILDRLHKHQNPKEMLKFVENSVKYNFHPILSTMTGFPDSKELGDFKDTVLFLQQAARINPGLEIKVFFCRPYPGTDLYNDYKEKGFYMPRTMEEWEDYTLRKAPYWVSSILQDQVTFFVFQFLPAIGWNFTWKQFLDSFETTRAKGLISTARIL